MMVFKNTLPLDSLELFANQVVEGFITGMHKSPYHGFSVEFAEHRLYNTGESTRDIDWKLFGRTDKLFVKRYDEETNLRCQLILDTSSSMYYPNFNTPTFENPNKILFSITAIASLMNLFKRQRDAVGLSACANEVHIHTPSKTTTRHHRLLYHELDKILSIDALKYNRKTTLSESLHHIAERIHRRSLVILFTDMIEEDNAIDSVFSAFKHLRHKKHEIILFYLTEPKTEHNFSFKNRPYKFIDIETQEEIKLNPIQYKESYKKASKEYLKNIRLKCLQYKIDLVEVDINQSLEQILISYLLKRKKMF
ncbi:MAG: DUF58 domain-containing protein [Bacteroidota bacterium]|nr:DUF58 domain-containing protein [Bacteroidota bacterium]